MTLDNDTIDEEVFEENRELAFTIGGIVTTNAYDETKLRLQAFKELISKVLPSDPNADGFYIGVREEYIRIKPMPTNTEDDEVIKGFDV